MPKTVGESSIPENGSPYPGFYVQTTPTFSITNAIYVILSGIIAVVYIHRHITTRYYMPMVSTNQSLAQISHVNAE